MRAGSRGRQRRGLSVGWPDSGVHKLAASAGGPVRSQKGRWATVAATILLVEDERKLRELVRSYLERAGFTVLST